MAIDQARGDPAALAVDRLPGIEAGRGIAGSAGIGDFPRVGRDQAALDQAEPWTRRRKRCETAAVPDPVNCHDGSCTMARLSCGADDDPRPAGWKRSPGDLGGTLSP